MTTFTLDTSGEVLVQRASSGGPFAFHWSDLDPFTQGYVEALFASERPGFDDAALGGHYVCGFSDLAPETLAAILKDCGAFQLAHRKARAYLPEHGSAFWRERNSGWRAWFKDDRASLAGRWPPLTHTLDDDGKVYLRRAA